MFVRIQYICFHQARTFATESKPRPLAAIFYPAYEETIPFCFIPFELNFIRTKYYEV